jgi:hypothetical protein
MITKLRSAIHSFLSAAKIVKKVTPQAELQCPLCQCMLNKPDFINHVGEHMEVIALHAMPNSISDLESDLELTILNNNISAEALPLVTSLSTADSKEAMVANIMSSKFAKDRDRIRRSSPLFTLLDLRQAVEKNDKQAVLNILHRRSNLHGVDDPESLMIAAEEGYAAVAEILLSNSTTTPDPEPLDNDLRECSTPMLTAIGKNNVEFIKTLLDIPLFDATRLINGKTYSEIAKGRKGPLWRQEEEVLNDAFRSYNKSRAVSFRALRHSSREFGDEGILSIPGGRHSKPDDEWVLQDDNRNYFYTGPEGYYCYSKYFQSLYYLVQPSITSNTNSFASEGVIVSMQLWLKETNRLRGLYSASLHTDRSYRNLTGVPLHWCHLKTTVPVEDNSEIGTLTGLVGFQNDYMHYEMDEWQGTLHPQPFVFFPSGLPFYIDTRREGSECRHVRRSCRPNAVLEAVKESTTECRFSLISTRPLAAYEEITIPWEFHPPEDLMLAVSWLAFEGGESTTSLPDDDYMKIGPIVLRTVADHGGCACNLGADCLCVRFIQGYFAVRERLKGPKEVPTSATTSSSQQRM